MVDGLESDDDDTTVCGSSWVRPPGGRRTSVFPVPMRLNDKTMTTPTLVGCSILVSRTPTPSDNPPKISFLPPLPPPGTNDRHSSEEGDNG